MGRLDCVADAYSYPPVMKSTFALPDSTSHFPRYGIKPEPSSTPGHTLGGNLRLGDLPADRGTSSVGLG